MQIKLFYLLPYIYLCDDGCQNGEHNFWRLEHNTPFFQFSDLFKCVQKSLQKYYHILFVPRLSACLRKETWML